MKNDVLEEVWQARDQIAAECGQDVDRLFEFLNEREALHPDRVVSFPPRRRAPGGDQGSSATGLTT
jgi:hypothetical protein